MGIQRRSWRPYEAPPPSEETPLIDPPKVEDEEGSRVPLSLFRGMTITASLGLVIFIQSEWPAVPIAVSR